MSYRLQLDPSENDDVVILEHEANFVSPEMKSVRNSRETS